MQSCSQFPKKYTLKRHAKTNKHMLRESQTLQTYDARFTDEKIKQRQTEV